MVSSITPTLMLLQQIRVLDKVRSRTQRSRESMDETTDPLLEHMLKADEKKLKEMFEQKKRVNEGKLQQQEQQKLEEEKQSLSKLFTNIKSGKTGKLKNLVSQQPLNECDDTPSPTIPNSPAVNNEHEPTELQWEPITFGNLVRSYPQSTAISDVYTVVHTVIQQPGLSRALLGEKGTKFLVKADKAGNLFRAMPSDDPQAFANTGLNPDYDEDDYDDTEKETAIKPLYVPTSKVKELLYKDNEFGVSENIEFEEVAKPKPVQQAKQSILEDVFSKSELNQIYSNTNEISIKSLNSLLYSIQKRLNTTNESKYEKVADLLSTLIAESLLVRKDTISFDKFIKKVNKY